MSERARGEGRANADQVPLLSLLAHAEIEGVHNLVTALIFSVADSQKAERLIDAHVATISRETGKETVKYRM